MVRSFSIGVALLLAIGGRANAIEMFTNFHNGENIGFPPMQVPYSVYGGIGRGGWNPHAQGMPLKANPFVPAMTPTGQLPDRRFDYYGAAPHLTVDKTVNVPQEQLISDRRRGRWQHGATSPEAAGKNSLTESKPTESKNGSIDSNNATSPAETSSILKRSPSSESSRRAESSDNAETTPLKSTEYAGPTVLHAESANAEMFSQFPAIDNRIDEANQGEVNSKSPSTSEAVPSADWPRADAPIKHSISSPNDAG